MAQIIRPDADISAGAWAATPLWSDIDEITPSDTDLIYRQGTGACEIGLETALDPVSSSGHIVRYRIQRSKTTRDCTIVVTLLDGATSIASWTHVNPAGSFTTFNQTLSSGEADNISDYADLRIQFDCTVNGGAGLRAEVSWAEFEIPNVPQAVLDQDTHRGRDDAYGINVDNGWLAALGADWTQETATTFRIRFLIQATTSQGEANQQFELRYSLNSGAYTLVSTSSDVIRSLASSQFLDDATTSQVIGSGTYGTGSSQGGDSDGLTGNIDFSGSDEAEIEFCITIPHDITLDGDNIKLRVYESGGVALTSYTDTPSITVSLNPDIPNAITTGNVTKGGNLLKTSTGEYYGIFRDGTSGIKIWKDLFGTPSSAGSATASAIHGGGSIDWISAAIDSNDDIHIVSSCNAEQTRDVAYRVFATGTDTWAGSWVEAYNYTATATDNTNHIAIDANDDAHVVCCDLQSGVDQVFYTNNISGWLTPERVATDTGLNQSDPLIVCDPTTSTDVHVWYYADGNNDPGYRKRASGSWGTISEPSTTGYDNIAAILIDSSGNRYEYSVASGGGTNLECQNILEMTDEGTESDTTYNTRQEGEHDNTAVAFLDGDDRWLAFVNNADNTIHVISNTGSGWTDEGELYAGSYLNTNGYWASQNYNFTSEFCFLFDDGTDVFAGKYTLSATTKDAAATLKGSGLVTAAPEATKSAAASLTGKALVTATAEATKSAAATLEGRGLVTATAEKTTVKNAAATLEGRALVTATPLVTVPAAASLTANALVAADAQAVISAAASLEGRGLVTASAEATKSAAATLEGRGLVTATGEKYDINKYAAATLTGQASVIAAAQAVIPASATITANAIVTASPEATKSAAAAITGSTNITATPLVTVPAAASLIGHATITAAPEATKSTAATLEGRGLVTATGEVYDANKYAAASLVGHATVTATAEVLKFASASISAKALVTAAPEATKSAVGSLSGNAVVTATPQLAKPASASLISNALVTAAPEATKSAAASLTGNALITASGQKLGDTSASASLVGHATVTATPQVVILASASITASATITATAQAVILASASIVGTASVTATPQLAKPASASLIGHASITATQSVIRIATASIVASAIMNALGYGAAPVVDQHFYAIAAKQRGFYKTVNTRTAIVTPLGTHDHE